MLFGEIVATTTKGGNLENISKDFLILFKSQYN
jgi:hypothetical protein